jgi:hypothetical protein
LTSTASISASFASLLPSSNSTTCRFNDFGAGLTC